MIFKFLIDECLSPSLVGVAARAGHTASTCVRDRGWSGFKDHQLIERVVDEDFTLVTRNAADFRGGGPDDLGGEHARQPIHAGLICLNSEAALTKQLQIELFDFTLGVLAEDGRDLVNQAFEVSHRLDDTVEWQRYAIPSD